MSVRLVHGDCVAVMRQMEPESVDAIVTDPPYGLGFMGKKWDSLPPGLEFAEAALRVAKPGAHIVAFGGTRTFHRLVCALEDAGWEIRDCLMWLYGTGFPKSHNGPWGGTALKPAWEPIVLARKPLTGTVASNVLEHGTGALNIDGCRVAGPPSSGGAGSGATALGQGSGWNAHTNHTTPIDRSMARGRWPANVLLDDVAGAALDEQAGSAGAASPVRGTEPSAAVAPDGVTGQRARVPGVFHADSGGPSRFFYTAKASRSEREAGLEHLKPKQQDETRKDGAPGGDNPRNRGNKKRANHHPTVKPIDLMRWLARLVTPPGGTVMDPFAGSGTTLCAAGLEGFDAIGIEKTAEYLPIIRGRVAHWTGESVEGWDAPRRDEDVVEGQMALF